MEVCILCQYLGENKSNWNNLNKMAYTKPLPSSEEHLRINTVDLILKQVSPTKTKLFTWRRSTKEEWKIQLINKIKIKVQLGRRDPEDLHKINMLNQLGT